jgi:SAM-dependent methyltransferase
MPDPYSQIASVDPEVLPVLINAMEVRAADPRQKAIRKSFLSTIAFPENASVLEVGCGSGAVCRDLAGLPNVREVVGLDPSPIFLAKARELASGIPNLRFDEGDARDLPYDDAAFDVVVLHTCLTHVPGPIRHWSRPSEFFVRVVGWQYSKATMSPRQSLPDRMIRFRIVSRLQWTVSFTIAGWHGSFRRWCAPRG